MYCTKDETESMEEMMYILMPHAKDSLDGSQVMDAPDTMLLPKGYQPNEYDIICGRGRGLYRQPGNRRFRAIILSHMEEYKNLKSRLDKTMAVNKIMDSVLSQNKGDCRFVRRVDRLTWEELDREQIRDKVGHAIREAISLRSNRKNTTDSAFEYCITKTLRTDEGASSPNLMESDDESSNYGVIEPIPFTLKHKSDGTSNELPSLNPSDFPKCWLDEGNIAECKNVSLVLSEDLTSCDGTFDPFPLSCCHPTEELTESTSLSFGDLIELQLLLDYQ